MKKSKFKLIAEAIANGSIKNSKMPADKFNRKLSLEEIKKMIKEEFEDAKAVSDVEADEIAWGTEDDELEKEIEWAKALDFADLLGKEEK